MTKNEVYSWRLSSELKIALEHAARRRDLSLSQLLEQVMCDWLEDSRVESENEMSEQKRLHAEAARTFGRIASGDPHLSTRARDLVRARLKKRHAG